MSEVGCECVGDKYDGGVWGGMGGGRGGIIGEIFGGIIGGMGEYPPPKKINKKINVPQARRAYELGLYCKRKWCRSPASVLIMSGRKKSGPKRAKNGPKRAKIGQKRPKIVLIMSIGEKSWDTAPGRAY